MSRTPIQYIYDSYDVLIDLHVANNLPERAQKLRKMRDNLPVEYDAEGDIID